MRNINIIVTASLTLLIFAARADACSCAPENFQLSLSERVLQSHAKSKAVFLGRVIAIKKGNEQTPKIVTLAVKQRLKGSITQKLSIATGSDDGDCGFNFEVGKDYLVYAFAYTPGQSYLFKAKASRKNNLATSQCERTALLRDVAKNELETLIRAKKR